MDYRDDKRYKHLSYEQVLTHFEVERELREHILTSDREDRATAFSWAYDELFRRVPWHPALTEDSGSSNPGLITERTRSVVPLISASLGRSVLELGCGMGELCIACAQAGFTATGLDVSEVRIERLKLLENPNLKFNLGEATVLPFGDESFDVVVSMQLFEHLHPNDIGIHLAEIWRVLRTGGFYLFETPNRLTGPRDVSRFFVNTPQGFHLREYSIRDLAQILSTAGYGRIEIILRKRRVLSMPVAKIIEGMWRMLPKTQRRSRSFGLDNPFYRAYKKR